MPDLVIVESPAKAKTIEKYLGKKYTVVASMGHLRDLPKSTLGVDIEAGFEPRYIPIKGKGKLINEIKKKVKESGMIYLATDPDREGEAISWHLKELLGLDDGRARRVSFNEITKKAVTDGIKAPRNIDMNLVNAQQARRILDRIVGYKVSPLLWKKIRRGLSAGRVQSVATKLVVEREDEIVVFVPEEYWNLEAFLKKKETKLKTPFSAKFYGNLRGKMELKTSEDTQKVIDAVKTAEFVVKSVKKGVKNRNPVPPFITSSLQQEASRRFNFTPRKTMSVAQTLYEGVSVEKRGMIGLITYMRTDSLRLSTEAVDAARSYIEGRFGGEYIPASSRVYRSRGNAQDAHEAIRPTYADLEPETVRKSLTNDQYRIYKLIWERFIACQMTAAVYDTVTADTTSAGYVFRASGSRVSFKGYTVLYDESSDDSSEELKNRLPELEEGEVLDLDTLNHEQKFTQPPLRYTDATLIRALEENGIGRPSTYAPTISTILDRDYVSKDGRYLKPTSLGRIVNDLMIERFADIVDVAFTANMEKSLDDVELGKKEWKSTLNDFYKGFSEELEKAEAELGGVTIKVPDEVTDIPCNLCGRMMVIKTGRFGKFLACPGYPECKNTKPIARETGGTCPKCGGKILQKKSKNGNKYFGCDKHPECDFMTWDTPLKDSCPKCGKTLFRHAARGERKIVCLDESCGYSEEIKRSSKKAAPTDE